MSAPQDTNAHSKKLRGTVRKEARPSHQSGEAPGLENLPGGPGGPSNEEETFAVKKQEANDTGICKKLAGERGLLSENIGDVFRLFKSGGAEKVRLLKPRRSEGRMNE